MHRVLDASSIYYTTDAMAAAGAPDGRYRIGVLEVESRGGVVRLPGAANFAGSCLAPDQGVRCLVGRIPAAVDVRGPPFDQRRGIPRALRQHRSGGSG